MSATDTKERPASAAGVADPASADDILIGYKGMAKLTGYSISTLKKKRKELPAPHINEKDSIDRVHRKLWLREKILAWVLAGMPADVDAFDAKWRKGRKA